MHNAELHMYTWYKGVQLKFELPTHVGPDLDRHAACDISQQYSSAAIVSLRVHSRKEKFNVPFKNFYFSFFILFFKSRKTGIA
jgi:hypothetical protein